MALGDHQIDEAMAEEAMQRAEKQLQSMDHSVDAEEVAHLQALIAKSLAQLKLKRRPR
jgi:F-type H+-transporting ATPase subunit epsilon